MRSRTSFLALFLLLFPPPAAAQADEQLSRGLKLLNSGEFSKALSAFDAVKLAAPDDPRPYFFAGLTLFRTNQRPQALAELQRAVELDPAEPMYALTLAEFLLRTGDTSRASATLASLREKAALEDLSDTHLWLLSDLYFRLNDYRESLAVLELYSGRKPGEERVYFRRAQLHLGLNDLESALAQFRIAGEKTSRKAAAHYGVGLVLFQKGELEKARSALTLAVEAEPENPEFVHMLATVLIDLDEAERAIEHLSRVEEKGAQFPQLYEARARAHRKLRQGSLAAEYIEKFRRIDSVRREERGRGERVRETLRQAQILLKAGNLQESARRLQDVLELDPENYIAHSYLAGIFMSLKDWNRTRGHIERAEAINPNAFETKYMVASFLYEQGRPEEALEHGLDAKKLQPGFPDLRNLLGNIHFALGDHRQAMQEYEAAMKLGPDREEFRINYEAAARALQRQ